MALFGLPLVRPAAVREDCECPLTEDPVCGVDSKTYLNSCHLQCTQTEMKHKGECAESSLLSGE
ncbi:serine proteinase inhibitor TgPI-2, putative [Eimeria necatrix]|uniref:Serine proteinase inhibitor TgPI-2, putative n=1 Tax=Eimeria necatrix TaxID=51315 RepID=U6MXP3_9EIME|nr:serine proteinase inhibitor TgPI-2, putative [Eimeria necatrix]CDJ68721.1 serine proteinase inhibitor TgPI-2, putative [Eimeria necatrix]